MLASLLPLYVRSVCLSPYHEQNPEFANLILIQARNRRHLSFKYGIVSPGRRLTGGSDGVDYSPVVGFQVSQRRIRKDINKPQSNDTRRWADPPKHLKHFIAPASPIAYPIARAFIFRVFF